MDQALQFLAVHYAEYVKTVPIVHDVCAAVAWTIFGAVCVCVAFWHTGTPLPCLTNHEIRKGQCSQVALLCAVLLCTVMAIPFAFLLEAVTGRQFVYAGVGVVFVLSSVNQLTHRLSG